jgi:hypothetical protein
MLTAFYRYQAQGKDAAVNRARESLSRQGSTLPPYVHSRGRTVPPVSVLHTPSTSANNSPSRTSTAAGSVASQQQKDRLKTLFAPPLVTQTIANQGLHPSIVEPGHLVGPAHRMFDALLPEGDLYTISPPESVAMDAPLEPPLDLGAGPADAKKRKRAAKETGEDGLSKGRGESSF